jgi:TrpR family trp operon transcriptional repressor
MIKTQKGWDELAEILLNIKDKKSLNQLLELLLTTEEKSDVITRFLITKALLSNVQTQREIAKDLNVSIAKITRGSNELKRTNQRFLKELQSFFRE